MDLSNVRQIVYTTNVHWYTVTKVCELGIFKTTRNRNISSVCAICANVPLGECNTTSALRRYHTTRNSYTLHRNYECTVNPQKRHETHFERAV